MRHKLYSLTILGFFLGLIILVFLNNDSIITNIINGVNLWTTRVFPSLFPMFVISDILINYGLADILGNLFSPVTKKLFKVDGSSAYVFVMSLISGCPSNAYITKELLKNGKISTSDATKVLCFSFFANPLFLLGILTAIFPSNSNLVIKIILVHYFTNIIIGILFRNYKQNTNNMLETNIAAKTDEYDFGTVLSKSISKAILTLINILGTIVFYIVISTAFLEILNFSNINSSILKGFLEITQGLNSLIDINISDNLKAIIAVGMISFGGLSIHTQIKSIIYDTNILYKNFFKARVLHMIISILIVLLFIAK